MRLLKYERSGWFETAQSFSLIEVDARNAPYYAILSHRWGADEVSLQHLENGTAKTKAGYKKLTFCAEQAARDGLLYFWIDACCIDKTSSAELSEAINSMFKWYRSAAKCYVYLPDVSSYPVDTWEQAFRRSEWFTRGWTLQELVAPSVLEFFSKEGTKLGDRKSLEQQINQITGIPTEALRGQRLSDFSEKERFSWTVGRQTTIEEDAVYCLLGIFDVQMPLLYGEGQQKALARLRREIQASAGASSDDMADAAWVVPFERNLHFTGREAQLADIKRRLFTQEHTSKIAIAGLGGVGKTQLVLEVLYQIKEERRDCSIMWIPATNMESLQQGYLVVARQLELPGSDDEKCDAKKLVQDHLSKDGVGPWLLVFDNADDVDMWIAAAPNAQHGDVERQVQGSSTKPHRLIDYLPKNKRGCIIFTTRTRKVAVKLAQRNVIGVSEMSPETATDLLKTSLIDPSLVDRLSDTIALLAALTHLPLAIAQASAYINENGITVSDYLRLLEDAEEDAIELLSEDFEDEGRYHDIRNPVATTWLVSFEQIRRHDPLATDYLSFMACVDPRDIPQSLLPPGSSHKQELEAIGTLTAYSFLSVRPGGFAFDLHRLVYLATRNWLRKQQQLSPWTTNAVTRLGEVFPDNNHKNRDIWRRYSPHVSQVLESSLIDKDDETRIDLMQRYGGCLQSDGRLNEAQALFVEVVASRTKTLGTSDLATLSSISWLASVLEDQGQFVEAERLAVQVLEAYKEKLGPDHNATMTITYELAAILWRQGRLEEAERLERQVLESYTLKLGANHPDTLTCMGNLAMTLSSQRRGQEAEELARKVLEVRKDLIGIDHPDTLLSMAQLAVEFWMQGKFKEAEELEVQVLEARRKILGPDHPSTLTTLHNLAQTLKDLNRTTEALELMRDCFERKTRALGVTHPNTLSAERALRLWEALPPDASGGSTLQEDEVTLQGLKITGTA